MMEDLIFYFVDSPAPRCQERHECKKFFEDASKALTQHAEITVDQAREDLTVLAQRIVGLKDRCYRIEWYAKFGCAILFNRVDVSTLVINVIGLDGWTNKVHAWMDGRQVTAVPDVANPSIKPLGEISPDRVEELFETFAEVMTQRAKENKKLHHTSDFLWARFVESLAKMKLVPDRYEHAEEMDLQGGSSDLGRHTGCLERNISFPLVASVYCALLESDGDKKHRAFHKMLCVYYLENLRIVCSKITDFDRRKIDRGVVIIREIKKVLASLDDKPFCEHVVEQTELYFQRLSTLRPERDSSVCDLPRIFEIPNDCGALDPSLFPEVSARNTETGDHASRMAAARNVAKRNLGFSNLLAYDPQENAKAQDVWVALGRIQKCFWNWAGILVTVDVDTKAIVRLLMDLQQQHEHATASVLEICKSCGAHILSVELKSCRMLVTSIAYCWAHRLAVERFPLFKSCKPVLDPKDLARLVLPDYEADQAMQHVRRFLLQNGEGRVKSPFRNATHTLDLALEVGRVSDYLKRRQKEEQAKASERIDDRYSRIQATQRKLETLDNELRVAKSRYDDAHRREQESRRRDYQYHHGTKVFNAAYYEREHARVNAWNQVLELERQIKNEEWIPEDTFLPLPRTESLALTDLFFLFMPKEFMFVFSLAHAVESELWKRVPAAPKPSHDLLVWFKRYSSGASGLVDLKIITLGTHEECVQSPPVKNIRGYGRETGVFFPDSYDIAQFWVGSDPFSSRREEGESEHLFTSGPTDLSDQHLKRYMVVLEEDRRSRGNLGIANKSEAPDWLSPEFWLMFTSLRAFPRSQFRQLLRSLIDNLLPFGHPCVHVLVKQALYQVGDKWKRDLESDMHVLERFAEQLNDKADQFQAPPNDVGELLLFGTIASFLGGYDGRHCLETSRKYTKVARGLAKMVEGEIQEDGTGNPDLYAKQARLYACALLSGSTMDTEPQSLIDLLELNVIFNYKKQFCEDRLECGLKSAVQRRMGERIAAIAATGELNPEILTGCLRLIGINAPDLTWTKVSYAEATDTACFEAEADHLYSINLLNGTVLVNGVPPRFLPLSIMEHELYVRTFQERTFECIDDESGDGCFKTTGAAGDAFCYSFKLRKGSLEITETRASTDGEDSERDMLQLLPRKVMEKLPTLLVEPFSHWYSPFHDAIFFRGVRYEDREISYVMTRDALHRIPPSKVSGSPEAAMALLEHCHRLVFSPLPTLRILSRIEKCDHILAWVDTNASEVTYSLPRLGLKFVQRSEVVFSTNYEGYSLKEGQVLNDTLLGVTSYLVLVDKLDKEKVLVPFGTVTEGGDVSIPEAWHVKSGCHTFDIHGRLGHLQACSILARLQLACMYAASSYLCVEAGPMRTGMDMAVELVRYCWTDEVLTEAVQKKLEEVCSWSNLCCTLQLMCHWVWKSSRRLSFLNVGSRIQSEPEELALVLDPLAAREYTQDDSFAPKLLPEEELYLLGTCRERIKLRCQEPKQDDRFDEHGSTRTSAFVKRVEAVLEGKCTLTRPSGNSERPFPLDLPREEKDGLEGRLDRESWKAFCSLEDSQGLVGSETVQVCEKLLMETKHKREGTEQEILETMNRHDSCLDRMAIMSGAIRRACRRDLLSLALDSSALQSINPSVSEENTKSLRVRIHDWMLLCVLEDKLRRVQQVATCNPNEVLEEARCKRNWDSRQHIEWLVFEVEQELQIRPFQYSIVKQLLENNHTMIQLNMGQGKTSVLVPMLLLELVNTSQDVIRVNMLSSIIHVAKEKYKAMLQSSVQYLKIRTLPFTRSAPLDKHHQEIISQELTRCGKEKCCVLVTPQDRNSLLMKQFDEDGMHVHGLKSNRFVDIIDESDVILHHSFQQTYAVGCQVNLPDGASRWNVIEALLLILSESPCPEIKDAREDRSAVHKAVSEVGTFPKLRLLPGFDCHMEDVRKALCRELISNPPYELQWMAQLSSEKVDLLVAIMSDREMNAWNIIESDELFLDNRGHILAARGCIAGGLLFHCLKARHRVKYGVDQCRRKMAVPFIASDTPSARSEFSQPDVAIIYTYLSYYHDGLSINQLKEALVQLQALGPMVQAKRFSSWIDVVRRSIAVSDAHVEKVKKFDSIEKVDPGNRFQLELMHPYLFRSMKVISFWLDTVVFPRETKVFPQSRFSSAWNLVDEGSQMGFSGTDDNQYLLPFFVEQAVQEEPELLATNGLMIDRILTCTNGVELLPQDENGRLWQAILQKCLEVEARALIDVSGLMAGIENRAVAEALAELLEEQSEFRGVLYYDVPSRAWNVVEFDSTTRNIMPLQVSSLCEAECFAYFDQSRCRGADLKLRSDARAVVTLEPNLTKARFLQGCARMRKLRPGEQSLILVGTEETLNVSATVKGILELTIRNTVKENKKGILELYERGMKYKKFPDAMDVDVALEVLYGGPMKSYSSMSDFLDATVECETDKFVSELVDFCKSNGEGLIVQGSQLTDECERELEDEKGKEKEEEVELPSVEPYEERDWRFDKAFSSGILGPGVFKISSAVSVPGVLWSGEVLCTENWKNTIKTAGQGSDFYLRPVNSFLSLPTGKIVLISDYEAERLLPYWYKAKNSSRIRLQHLALFSAGIWLGGDQVELPASVRTSVKFFRGYVSFEEDEKRALESLFVRRNPRESIQKLLELRYREQFMDRSDLDTFVRRRGG
ncbi:Protein of unknown function (DUF3645) [Seminavis robusta]|uniref:ubiquitinyl hydrolase 1 n=1 Tax=Seminavis robusta TaxID=568900 RepID=A0A9N8DM77_9STRA|nr:Protein of unknown function (DUF3645) [Seminavis robusta]|eukprot:Sro203_g085640.1 Protein of unknown function (DUF3645) (2670) ;mRNA; f:62302-70465